MVELKSAASPNDVAEAIVLSGVATHAAAGFGVRDTRGGWEFHVGGYTGLYDLASLTKPMTAFAVAQSGLDRRATLGSVLEEARGTVSENVPLELLLSHRAGLEANLPIFEPLLRGEAIDRRATLHRAANARREDARGPLTEDGAAPVYSDLGYILVGEALARYVGAHDAGEAIESRVVGSIGSGLELGTARSLRATRRDFDELAVPTEDVAWRGGVLRGVVHDENAWALTRDGGSGHAGMFGTIGAVLVFATAALDAIARSDGPLATGDSLEWMIRTRTGGDLRAGFDGKTPGGASSAGTLAGPRTFGHLGFTGTSMWIDPDADVAFALLTNRVHPTRENTKIRAARPLAHDALFRLAMQAFRK